MNRAAVHHHVRALDLAPTILKYLSVPGYDAMKGKLLL
jgi:bisphosphoglycerate-independent phosphoglycerate mutase (AlkP superfamily)